MRVKILPSTPLLAVGPTPFFPDTSNKRLQDILPTLTLKVFTTVDLQVQSYQQRACALPGSTPAQHTRQHCVAPQLRTEKGHAAAKQQVAAKHPLC